MTRPPQQVLSSSPKTSMAWCDEFKTLEQSKTEPPKRQGPELSGEASLSARKGAQPCFEQGAGSVRKGPGPAAQKRRGGDPVGDSLRGLCALPGPGSAGAGRSRGHEQPLSVRGGCQSPKVAGPGPGFPALTGCAPRAGRAPPGAQRAEAGHAQGRADPGTRSSPPGSPTRVHAREREESLE